MFLSCRLSGFVLAVNRRSSSVSIASLAVRLSISLSPPLPYPPLRHITSPSISLYPPSLPSISPSPLPPAAAAFTSCLASAPRARPSLAAATISAAGPFHAWPSTHQLASATAYSLYAFLACRTACRRRLLPADLRARHSRPAVMPTSPRSTRRRPSPPWPARLPAPRPRLDSTPPSPVRLPLSGPLAAPQLGPSARSASPITLASFHPFQLSLSPNCATYSRALLTAPRDVPSPPPSASSGGGGKPSSSPRPTVQPPTPAPAPAPAPASGPADPVVLQQLITKLLAAQAAPAPAINPPAPAAPPAPPAADGHYLTTTIRDELGIKPAFASAFLASPTAAPDLPSSLADLTTATVCTATVWSARPALAPRPTPPSSTTLCWCPHAARAAAPHERRLGPP